MRWRGMAWPTWTSGAVGSIPSFTRSGRPSASLRSSSPSGRTSTALRVSSAIRPPWPRRSYSRASEVRTASRLQRPSAYQIPNAMLRNAESGCDGDGKRCVGAPTPAPRPSPSRAGHRDRGEEREEPERDHSQGARSRSDASTRFGDSPAPAHAVHEPDSVGAERVLPARSVRPLGVRVEQPRASSAEQEPARRGRRSRARWRSRPPARPAPGGSG